MVFINFTELKMVTPEDRYELKKKSLLLRISCCPYRPVQ